MSLVATALLHFMAYLSALLEVFRFIKRYRERAAQLRAESAAERERERAHQLALVEGLVKMIETLAENQQRTAASQSAALIELAKSSQASAEAFGTWLKSFTAVAGDPTTTSVVREEDEFDEEQMRLADKFGISPSAVADLPPEFALALELQRGIRDIGKTSPL